MEEKVTISKSELQYIIDNMDKNIKDYYALQQTFNKVFLADNNLSYEDRRNVSQAFVKAVLTMIKADRRSKAYCANVLVNAQKTYGDVANGNILYHFDTQDRKDIEILLSIPEINMMIKRNQKENLNLDYCNRLPSVLFPVNLHDKKFRAIYLQRYVRDHNLHR